MIETPKTGQLCMKRKREAYQSENALWVTLAHGCGGNLLQAANPLRVVTVELGVPLAASEFDLRGKRARGQVVSIFRKFSEMNYEENKSNKRHCQRAHLGGIHDDDLVAADEVGLQSRLVFADEQARDGGGETTNNL